MGDIHTDILYYDYNMYHTTFKFDYKHPEAKLRVQNLSPLDLLGLIGRQGDKSIQKYNIRIIIYATLQLNFFSNILRLHLECKTCPF